MKVDQARELITVTIQCDDSDDLFYIQSLGFSFTNSPNWADNYPAIRRRFWEKGRRMGTRLLWENEE
jgi:hypothetical protein